MDYEEVKECHPFGDDESQKVNDRTDSKKKKDMGKIRLSEVGSLRSSWKSRQDDEKPLNWWSGRTDRNRLTCM